MFLKFPIMKQLLVIVDKDNFINWDRKLAIIAAIRYLCFLGLLRDHYWQIFE
jgi:hypothetical protein